MKLSSKDNSCRPVPAARTQSVIRFASSVAELQQSSTHSDPHDVTVSGHSPLQRADSPSSISGDISLSSAISAESADPFALPAGRFGATLRSLENEAPSSGRGDQIVRFPGRSTFGNASMEILKEAMSSCFSRPFNSPSIIDKYWETVRARNTTFENTIACVTAAYETAYGDQIAKFSHLMISALRDGLVPHQPQATPLRLIRLLTANREDTIVRLVRFATLLPGFRDLSDGDQRILIAEKLLMSYLLHLSKYFYKGEHYFILPGPDNVHCSRSVMDSLGLDQDYLHFVESSMARLNSIGLTLPETYLLLAAAIFYPEVTTAVNRTLMEHLHSLYMDALFYSVGRRLGVADRAVVYAKVQKVVTLFPLIDKASMGYVQSINLNAIPMHPRAIIFKNCVTK